MSDFVCALISYMNIYSTKKFVHQSVGQATKGRNVQICNVYFSAAIYDKSIILFVMMDVVILV